MADVMIVGEFTWHRMASFLAEDEDYSDDGGEECIVPECDRVIPYDDPDSWYCAENGESWCGYADCNGGCPPDPYEIWPEG